MQSFEMGGSKVGRLLGVCLVLAAAGASAQVVADNPWLERRVLNMAHRGGRAEAPEHTIYAYLSALPKGVTTLEIDVQRSRDGVLVVHHDATVDRVTNGSGRIDSLTLAELRALDNAYWYSPGCGGICRGQPPEAYPFRGVATGQVRPPRGFHAEDFQIATLEEVLAIFPDVLMSIEVKGEAPASVPAAEQTADLLRASGRVSDVLVASFDDATIAAFKARDPGIHTTPGLLEVADFFFNPGPLPEHRALQVPRLFQGILVPNPDFVAAAHENQLAVYVFIDPNEETPTVYGELIDAGVDGIISDRPTLLQATLEERGLAFDPPASTKSKKRKKLKRGKRKRHKHAKKQKKSKK